MITLAIKSLCTVMCNPALGGGSSLRTSEAAELLGILGVLNEDDNLEEFTEILGACADEGRAPKTDEWSVLRGLRDELEVEDEPECATEDESEPTSNPEPEPEPEPQADGVVLNEDGTPAVDTLPDDDEPVVEPPQ